MKTLTLILEDSLEGLNCGQESKIILDNLQNPTECIIQTYAKLEISLTRAIKNAQNPCFSSLDTKAKNTSKTKAAS
jgi:hypothetical protein